MDNLFEPALSAIPWPADKPIAQIYFCKLLTLGTEVLPTVWVMLPQQELHRFCGHDYRNRCQSSCIFPIDSRSSSSSTLCWITTLTDLVDQREPNPRYLRCYLDLHTAFGQNMIREIGQQGQYHVLLFALENSQASAHTMAVSIPPDQRLRLLSLLPPL